MKKVKKTIIDDAEEEAYDIYFNNNPDITFDDIDNRLIDRDEIDRLFDMIYKRKLRKLKLKKIMKNNGKV